MINDFINKTNHTAVIAVTQAEGWSTPNTTFFPPSLLSPSLPLQYCLLSANNKATPRRERNGAGCWRQWGGGSHEGGREWRGRGRMKKSENPFWNPFSIRGPQAVITGVPEWGPVSENVSYPFLKWNLIRHKDGGDSVSVNYFLSLLLTGTLFLSDDIPLYLLLII